MEVTRSSATAGGFGTDPESMEALRVRQMEAHTMLRGDLTDEELEAYVESRVLTTTLDQAFNWARSNALFPATFGLACCAIEMITLVGGRLDIARIGSEAMRASPRQADLLILSGRVSIKMAPIIRRIYDQMLEPKWTIAMGACSSSMGVFNNYAIVPADKFLPVDVHVPGCPPRPEAVMYGVIKLREQIQQHPDLGWRARYDAGQTIEVLGTEGVPGGGGTFTTTHTDAEGTIRTAPAASAPGAATAVRGRRGAAKDAAAAPGLVLPPSAATEQGNGA